MIFEKFVGSYESSMMTSRSPLKWKFRFAGNCFFYKTVIIIRFVIREFKTGIFYPLCVFFYFRIFFLNGFVAKYMCPSVPDGRRPRRESLYSIPNAQFRRDK